MTQKYTDVVYAQRPKTIYPAKLIHRLNVKFGPWTNPEAQILDLGCGDLTFTKEFEKYYKNVFGLENDFCYLSTKTDWGERISSRYEEKCDFNKQLPYESNYFDFILCKSVIEHIWETDNFLKEILRILKPGGKLVILTPSWEYNYGDFYNDYTHIKPFHRKGLQDALKINGFQGVNVEYFYHLDWLWGRPYLMPVVKFLSLFARWKWKDAEETKHRVNIRFSQEVQLLGVAVK